MKKTVKTTFTRDIENNTMIHHNDNKTQIKHNNKKILIKTRLTNL